jgi:hypothetical protein
VLVSGRTLAITSGGGSANAGGRNQAGDRGPGTPTSPDSTAESAKGIKAGVDLTITGMVTGAGAFGGGFPGAPGGRTRP